MRKRIERNIQWNKINFDSVQSFLNEKVNRLSSTITPTMETSFPEETTITQSPTN
jgi:hypothetical protein